MTPQGHPGFAALGLTTIQDSFDPLRDGRHIPWFGWAPWWRRSAICCSCRSFPSPPSHGACSPGSTTSVNTSQTSHCFQHKFSVTKGKVPHKEHPQSLLSIATNFLVSKEFLFIFIIIFFFAFKEHSMTTSEQRRTTHISAVNGVFTLTPVVQDWTLLGSPQHLRRIPHCATRGLQRTGPATDALELSAVKQTNAFEIPNKTGRKLRANYPISSTTTNSSNNMVRQLNCKSHILPERKKPTLTFLPSLSLLSCWSRSWIFSL